MSAISQKITCRVENEAFFLEPQGSTINFPVDAEDFSVTALDGKMEVHAVGNHNSRIVPHKFYLRRTGVRLNGCEGSYIGTISLLKGYSVVHLFKASASISSPTNAKRVIYKYPIDGDESKVILPEGAQKICTFVCRDKLCLYAIVDPTLPSVALPY